MKLRISLFVVLVGLFYAAEILRDSDRWTSTLLSMLAWTTFAVFFLLWAWEHRGAREALRELASVAVLALGSFTLLYAYYVRSGTLTSGVHVDAAYSYLGITWFRDLNNPITFAGATPSYSQPPLTLLNHLPALAIGFDRLGAFAVHFGGMVEFAILLAVVTRTLVSAPLPTQAAIVALVSAMVSNRMLVTAYDKPGYAFPAICVALMFLIVVDDRAAPDPYRPVGGLLALALLHHYPGFFFTLPVCIAWLVCARSPVARLRTFVARNPVVVAVLVMASVTLLIHPELIVRRVRDLAVHPQGGAAAWAHIRSNARYLMSAFPQDRFQKFFISTPPSWHLVDLPPLGGWLGPFVAGSWLLSFLTLPKKRLRYVIHLSALALMLAGLSVLQHLLIDFMDYRDFVFCFAMLMSGLTFAFRLPSLGRRWRVLAAAYAIAFGLYNYVDVGKLRGRLHATADYAHRSQEAMERLLTVVRRGGLAHLEVARIHVVLDQVFPLLGPYLEAMKRQNFSVHPVPAPEYCANPRETIERIARGSCEAFVFVVNTEHCEQPSGAPKGRGDVRGYLYGAACDEGAGQRAERARVALRMDARE